MRYAINIPNFGLIGGARALAELAHEAEESGWDGFFLWDHMGANWGESRFADPWLALTAIALATSRITIGPLVTPLPRRRPWKVAREAVTLDHLSNGRLVLGVGIGSDHGQEFSAYGEDPADKPHGEMLDEALEVITRLWSEELVDYDGVHYHVHGARHLPGPLQKPRIPIWVAAVWPNKKPFRRAAQWVGVVPLAHDRAVTPAEMRDLLAFIQPLRPDPAAPYEVVTVGHLEGSNLEADAAVIAEWEAAGATWFQEGFLPDQELDLVRERIRGGPPRV
jgi:alkanesulfonate monooxygenase SsuD/methylene tetrahydromethanopterin reductase-like flavin-dependent oxidoreductase (luciferase family)